MSRSMIGLAALLAFTALGSAASGEEFQFNRDWIGRIRFYVSLNSNSSQRFQVGSAVPSNLSGRIDDVADTFTLDSLIYQDGGRDLGIVLEDFDTVTTFPTDFPDTTVTTSNCTNTSAWTASNGAMLRNTSTFPPAPCRFPAATSGRHPRHLNNRWSRFSDA